MTKNVIWTLATLVLALALFFVYQDNVKLRNSIDLIDEAVATNTILNDKVKNMNNISTWDDTLDSSTWNDFITDSWNMIWASVNPSLDVKINETTAE